MDDEPRTRLGTRTRTPKEEECSWSASDLQRSRGDVACGARSAGDRRRGHPGRGLRRARSRVAVAGGRRDRRASAAPSASAQRDAVRERGGRRPELRDRPVVLNAYFETGFDLPFKLSEEFTKQFPNVTWDIKQDQFTNLMTATPRLLSGDNPPDLIRLPSMVSLVKDGLLKNLDDYATAFGWDKWSAAQLAQNRVAEDGTRGSGSLYAMGLNYSMTGVFYNKELATQIGMTAAADDASPSSRPCSPRPRTPGSSRSCSGTPRPAAVGSPSRSRT